MNMMFEPLRKYAQFTGRARRSEFWMFYLLLVIIEVVFMVLMNLTGMTPGQPPAGPAVAFAGLFGLVMLGLLIPSLAVTFRRLHDTNRSAWWILVGVVPILGALALLVFYLLPGTPGPNKYGPDPKGAGEEVSTVFA
ncbi:DUF805 domain-containing protein [Phenylobacterium sp.]|jgi:uncharacterized membrane protein YhaH (DUF805 family)|uniref:DUF805 domain-containing protein n=1 Tax=Phenylobacterium sp. TaxID=1871053 RepID=UPI002F40FB8F